MKYIDLRELEIIVNREHPSWKNDVVEARKKVAKAILNARKEAVKERGKGKKIDLVQVSKKARNNSVSKQSHIWKGFKTIFEEYSASKCWTCESIENRSDNPVDHFRPKNNVEECSSHSGYWWLAFDWKNFRFSCTYCNSRRIFDNSEGGKHDHFPVFEPPGWKIKPHIDINERPLLIDPTEIDDVCDPLIMFSATGEALPVAKDIESDDYKRAEKSIYLYHLNHSDTSRARDVLRQQVDIKVKLVNTLIEQGLDLKSESIKELRTELVRMIRHRCKTSQFTSAAREYLTYYEKISWVSQLLRLSE